jgi:putative nucleotidyltransferase with HDIG domain
MNIQTLNNNNQNGSTTFDISALVKTKLPPLPGSIMKISALLRDINVSTRAISKAISYDPSLTARILRVANSPLYSLQRNITSLNTAIEAVGLKAVHDIVMLGFTANTFAYEIRNSVLGRTIWEHSLAVGLMSRELSELMGMRGGEETFICGLLHDIGKLLLLRADVERFSVLLEKKDENEMLNWESITYGYNHAEIGSLVARRWGLPEDVCYSILNHHNPSQAEKALIVSHLVNVADTIANINGYGLRLEDESALAYSESVMMLDLTQEQLFKAWENTLANLEEVVNSLS